MTEFFSCSSFLRASFVRQCLDSVIWKFIVISIRIMDTLNHASARPSGGLLYYINLLFFEGITSIFWNLLLECMCMYIVHKYFGYIPFRARGLFAFGFYVRKKQGRLKPFPRNVRWLIINLFEDESKLNNRLTHFWGTRNATFPQQKH